MNDPLKVDVVDLNVKKLIQALKEPAVVRVGILGSKAGRKGKVPSNAVVGAAHEFGTSIHPRRSFLFDPLREKLQQYVEKSKAFTDDVVKQVIAEKSMIVWLRKLGVIAESVVLDAFATGGFGKWVPWKSKQYKNNTGQLLLDTTQLRNSITSDVRKG